VTGQAVRSGEVDALGDALRAAGSVQITLDRVWSLWLIAAPRLVGDATQTAALYAALHRLAEAGTVELPSDSWDQSTRPPLPRFVKIPTARQAVPRREWMTYPWSHELGWASTLPTLSADRFRDLVALNSWLARTRDLNPPTVPLRYRSVEILGDEKRLEKMVKTDLFGPGRLTLALFHCVRIPAPLPAALVGRGSDVLVVENSDTYWAAVEQLRATSDHPVGSVAWGSGKTFPSQVDALSVDVGGRGPVTGRVWYWGDLDPTGLEIAGTAADAAAIAILPARTLWSAMADRPVQESGRIEWTGASGRGWLGDELWDELAPVRNSAGRVAQEAVPPEAIAAWARVLDH